MAAFPQKKWTFDFCVVGGGIAGICAAVSAARLGISTALVQERPMLGGNASSEIRMWISGAHGPDNRESGILEEINLRNFYRNPYKNYSVWDSILFEIVKEEANIKLFLNTSCFDGTMHEDRLESIRCWQMTTQSFHTIAADYFADCSGDSVLAPISGALFMTGREGKGKYGESIAPDEADSATMGNSLLLQAREYSSVREFIPPAWAEKISTEQLSGRMPDLSQAAENFWYLELGGRKDTIRDSEEIRDELLALVYGMWDFLKNNPSLKEKNNNFDLDWIGMLPGKRESRRYIGDLVMTQHDVASGGKFDDIIAYGGWTMDDHHPDGFRTSEPPNIFHDAPSPFGIPYRCIYSKNIGNLFFAGRNISVSHAAFSATRVMGTCALLGQAAGTAASLAVKHALNPRELGIHKIRELQETLMDNDQWLPGKKRSIPAASRHADLSASSGDAELLRNGFDRKIHSDDNGWYGYKGDWFRFSFGEARHIEKIRIVFDSDLNRFTLPKDDFSLGRNMWHNILLRYEAAHVPKTLIREFEIVLQLENGTERKIHIDNNIRRLCFLEIDEKVRGITFFPVKTWGVDFFHVYSCDAR